MFHHDYCHLMLAIKSAAVLPEVLLIKSFYLQFLQRRAYHFIRVTRRSGYGIRY